jgi:hypothetical protein
LLLLSVCRVRSPVAKLQRESIPDLALTRAEGFDGESEDGEDAEGDEEANDAA